MPMFSSFSGIPLWMRMNTFSSYWLAVSSARTAVTAALAEMVATGEITEEHALELAKGYLHDNAARIYAQ
jgi:hypothetical protein